AYRSDLLELPVRCGICHALDGDPLLGDPGRPAGAHAGAALDRPGGRDLLQPVSDSRPDPGEDVEAVQSARPESRPGDADRPGPREPGGDLRGRLALLRPGRESFPAVGRDEARVGFDAHEGP